MAKEEIEKLSKSVDRLTLDFLLESIRKIVEQLPEMKAIKAKIGYGQQYISIVSFETSRIIERLKNEFQLGALDYLEVVNYGDEKYNEPIGKKKEA